MQTDPPPSPCNLQDKEQNQDDNVYSAVFEMVIKFGISLYVIERFVKLTIA